MHKCKAECLYTEKTKITKKKYNDIRQKYILASAEKVGNLLHYEENSLITMGDCDHCCLLTINYCHEE